MTEYIDIFLDYNDKDVKDVFDEIAKGDAGDIDIINQFHSRPEKIWNVECKEGETPDKDDYHWHIVVTREQYDQRVADEKDVKDFTNCDVKYKKPKKDKPGEYDPRHVFGSRPNIPKEKQPIIEIEAIRQ